MVFGNIWNYFNIVFMFVVYIVEVIINMFFDEYVVQYILQFFGMEDVIYCWLEVDFVQVVILYWEENLFFFKYSNDFYLDGSLIVLNEDMGKYMLDMICGVSG